MNDLECPYCDADNDVDETDFTYEEDEFRKKCTGCGKEFTFWAERDWRFHTGKLPEASE